MGKTLIPFEEEKTMVDEEKTETGETPKHPAAKKQTSP